MSMIIKGKFNEAKIYTDIVEQSASKSFPTW